MSHRRVHSQGNIPFSWEDTPGVSKVVHQDSPKNKVGLDALNLTSPILPHLTTTFHPGNPDTFSNVMVNEIKIPLPPCPKPKGPQHQQGNLSSKGFYKCWQEDPFLAAYKECTKVVGNGKSCKESKRSLGFKWKNMPIFSCNRSCDVKDEAYTFTPRGI